MKTPEQIADEMLNPLGDDSALLRDLPSRYRDEVREGLIAAVEADRAQRAEGTVTIELDPEHLPEETVAEVLDQIERGMTSGHYPNWEMNDLEREGG